MSKKLQLSIHEPCHENWEGMSPVEKGRFCGSCQKQVVDFSNMSDNQVAQFFKKPSTGSICGRFMSDQLDRDIVIPKKRLPWMKYFFQILLPAIFISKASAQKIGKVAYRPVKEDTTRIPTYQDIPTMGTIAPTIIPVCKKDTNDRLTVKGEINVVDIKRNINGIITDENGQPVAGASVTIKGTRNSVPADNKGDYRIQAKMGDILVIAMPGFLTKEIVAGTSNPVNVTLSRVCTVLAGMIAIDRNPDRTKRIPVKDTMIEFPIDLNIDTAESVTTEIIPDTENELPATSLFKLYPNPLKPGEEVSLEFKNPIEGNFTLQWLDLSGRLIKQEEFLSQSKRRIFQASVPSVTAGSYFLVLTDKKTGKRFTEKIIVQ